MNNVKLTWEESVLQLRSNEANKGFVEACFFDDPLIDACDRYMASTEWGEVVSYLPKTKGQGLDVGAGRGMVSYALAREGWSVVALEPDPSHVVGAGAIRTLAAETQLNIEVVEKWGEGLPFLSNHFDVVVCRQVLHHAHHLGDFCREVARVLKPGGVFLGLREHVIDRQEDLPVFLDSHPLHGLYGGENAFLLKDYKRSFKEGGLRLNKILNPFESNINLYPSNKDEVKRRWACRIGLPIEKYIPDFILTLRGAALGTPGRIYSFVGTKARE